MGVVNSWDTHVNFWNVNPQLKTGGEFAVFYTEDKSKTKHDSSSVMWAIAYVYDNDSQYKNWSLKDRIRFVEEEILNKVKFEEKKYKKLIDQYNSLQDTPILRQLKEWNRIMDEKSDLLRTMKYNIATWEVIEEMLKSNKGLYTEYERLLFALSKDESGNRVKGGSEESLSEKGELDILDDVSK
jgi:hypothetical protein